MLHILLRGVQGTAKLISNAAKQYGPLAVEKGKELYYRYGDNAVPVTEFAGGAFSPGPASTLPGWLGNGAAEFGKFCVDNWKDIKHRGICLKQ
jgi:hypothetical protein